MEATVEPEAERPVQVVTAEEFAQVKFEQPLFNAEDVAAWQLGSIVSQSVV